MSLPLLIAATWSFESKDPRDKIYAILSLAAPLPPEDQITIDYTSPVEDLYTHVAHIFLRGSGRDSMYNRGNGLAGILEPLEGLSYVQDPYYSGQQARMPELPSWVPDFSNPLTTNRIWRRSFRAAKMLEPEIGPGEDKKTLQILGAQIDFVEAVEPGWAELDPDDMPDDIDIDVESWFKLLETMEPNSGESPIQMLFRTLSVDTFWENCDKETRGRSIDSFRESIAWELACHIRKTYQEEEEASHGSEEAPSAPMEVKDDSTSGEEESELSSDSDSSSDDGSGTVWTCNGCDRELVAGDWHCESCEDFDLCWECFRNGKLKHDPKHDFTLYQISPNEKSPAESRKRAKVPSRLAKLLHPQNASASTDSISLEIKTVRKRISRLRFGRWFGEHGEISDKDSNDSETSWEDDDGDSTGTTGNNRDHENSTDTTNIPGLKQSLLRMLDHQRSLENANKNSEGWRFLPTSDEIPAQDKLTGALWEWCKYHGDPSTCSTLDDESHVRLHMVKFYRKRCLFRTRAGRLGLGPQSVRAGDEVWLVAGSRTPYLLREKGQDNEEEAKDRYGFLGEAYVHGVMYGEAAVGIAKEDLVRIHLE